MASNAHLDNANAQNDTTGYDYETKTLQAVGTQILARTTDGTIAEGINDKETLLLIIQN